MTRDILSRRVPLKASQTLSSTGFPGRLKPTWTRSQDARLSSAIESISPRRAYVVSVLRMPFRKSISPSRSIGRPAPTGPRRAMTHFLVSSSIVLAGAMGVPTVALAQRSTSDSLARFLAVPSLHRRADAVARLNTLPLAQLSPSARTAIVALLDAEATGHAPVDPDTLATNDERYGEYILDLTDLVVKLQDPASLRGLTRLGISSGDAAQRLVASFGTASLPPLSEAWNADERVRPSVVTTWAFMLAVTGPRALGASDRSRVLGAILSATDRYPMAVAIAARAGSLTALSPLLADVAARSPSDIVRSRAEKAVTVLGPARDATPPAALLAQTADWLSGVCGTGEEDDASREPPLEGRPRKEVCATLRNDIRHAGTALTGGRLDVVRGSLNDIVVVAASARTRGTLTQAEAALVGGNARYLLSRL
jgi:hypothetical protein